MANGKVEDRIVQGLTDCCKNLPFTQTKRFWAEDNRITLGAMMRIKNSGGCQKRGQEDKLGGLCNNSRGTWWWLIPKSWEMIGLGRYLRQRKHVFLKMVRCRMQKKERMIMSFIVAGINLRCQLGIQWELSNRDVHLEFTEKVGLEFLIYWYNVEMVFKSTRFNALTKEWVEVKKGRRPRTKP